VTAPFVSELRTSDEVIQLGEGAHALHLRVQVAELWDALRVDAAPSDSVDAVKHAALAKFYPDGISADEFVVKVRGFEILNESRGLAESGIRDGSTLLLSRRRRRPVK
jgi:hypothetical protein